MQGFWDRLWEKVLEVTGVDLRNEPREQMYLLSNVGLLPPLKSLKKDFCMEEHLDAFKLLERKKKIYATKKKISLSKLLEEDFLFPRTLKAVVKCIKKEKRIYG